MGLPPFLYYICIYILTFISRKSKNSDVPVEKLGGRDLNEDLKAQARRKVPESKLKTGMLDPIEVLSSPIQESERTITLLTETVASLRSFQKTSTDTEGPKEGSAGDDYSYSYSI